MSQFSGPIPPQWASGKYLWWLDMGFNNITGTIPEAYACATLPSPAILLFVGCSWWLHHPDCWNRSIPRMLTLQSFAWVRTMKDTSVSWRQ